MARIAARVERPIKIHRMEGRIRDQVAVVQGFNLPDAIRRWTEAAWDDAAWADAWFQANTVSIVTRDGREELYVATD